MEVGHSSRFGKWRPLLLISITLVLVIGGLGLFVLPRLTMVKSWRSDQLARQAMAAMDSAEWTRAYQKSTAALQLGRQNPEALRAAARLNSAAGLPLALTFHRELLATGQASATDYLRYSDALLQAGLYSAFLKVMAETEPQLPGDPRVKLLLARYASATGDWPSASPLLREILSSPQASPADQALAARVLLSLPIPEGHRPAAEWLLENLTGNEADSSPLEAILATPQLPDDLRNRASAAIEKIPGRHFEGRIAIATTRLRAHPENKEQVFRELEQKVKTPEDQRALASFFVQAGENQRALDLLPLSLARTRKDFFLVWLDAAAGLGKWEEVLQTLKSPSIPLEPALRDLFRARCHEALGEKSAADTWYEQAARTPTEDNTILFYLAGYFNQQNRFPLAVTVLKRLTSDPLASRTAYQSLINLYRLRGDSEALRQILADMHQRWPQDAAVSNDLNYLNLLLKHDLASTLEKSSRLNSENPDLFPLKITYALALLRADRAEEGLQVFEGSDIQLGQLLPGQKVIFSALLQANGMTDAALSARSALDPTLLLSEERALITP